MTLIMIDANDVRVMGKWTNKPALNLLGWTATALMAAATIAMFVAR